MLLFVRFKFFGMCTTLAKDKHLQLQNYSYVVSWSFVCFFLYDKISVDFDVSPPNLVNKIYSPHTSGYTE